MGTQSSIIPYLFLATFAIVIVYGILQFFKAKKAKQEHHTSAAARQGEDAGKAAATGQPSAGVQSPPAPPIVPR